MMASKLAMGGTPLPLEGLMSGVAVGGPEVEPGGGDARRTMAPSDAEGAIEERVAGILMHVLRCMESFV